MSHDQTGIDHAAFLSAIWDASCSVGQTMYRKGSVFHGPRLINSDCAGGIQNCDIWSLAKPDQVKNMIMWANVVSHILFWYEAQLNLMSRRDHWQDFHPCFTAISHLDEVVPAIIHACRSHVYRAIVDWIRSKDCPCDVRNLGERIHSMFCAPGGRDDSH